jgi:hypothetical protein
LDIDQDVLASAKELAAKEKKTAGKVISEMFRRGIHHVDSPISADNAKSPFVLKNGIPVLPTRGELISTEHVERIMNDEGI